MSAPSIELRALHHAFGPVDALADLSLTVASGETVAIVGPSGCGKSTALAVAAGLMEPDLGAVLIDGRPDPRRLGRLALMPQRDALLPWRTVLENVTLAPMLSGTPAGTARAQAIDLLRRLGLAGFERHFPHALSGGMRQRAALARTVLSGARVWLLDEPLGALDALTRADLHLLLARLHARLRPTTLLVTHDLDEALLLADRVLVSSPRPARIVAQIDVTLARPRTLDTTLTPDFVALRGALLDALRTAGALTDARVE